MAYLALKINAVELGVTKTIQLSSELSIHEVCKEIREKFGEKAGGADHALFLPLTGKWLLPNKVLDYYELRSGDILEFKKKHRPFKVQTLDGALKTVIIDESLPVQQLVDIICDKWGIINSDEYSFLPETALESDNAKGKTKDSKKGKHSQLAGQISSDAKWLNPEKTLAEQGITENDIIVFKKKFFYTDQNIDKNDPVQLNLLFNQAKEAILSGKHPCNEEEAVKFAAIQCQVQYGNHEPDRHKPGFLKLKDFLPPEYQKTKDIEKRIFNDHKKMQGLDTLGAKHRYVQLSRTLKTYGFTFFLVKEKDKKKNKMISILLGITRQYIVRLDADTKETLQQWNLTQLRRWAAAPNSFTLDFGDYADAYYNVQTSEGEQISQLIAGYIDIIMKKRKEAEKNIQEDEEKLAIVEEYMKPGKSSAISVGNSALRGNTMGPVLSLPSLLTPKFVGGLNSFKPTPVTPNWGAAGMGNQLGFEAAALQQAILLNIRNAFAMANSAANDLNVSLPLPPLGDDPASLEWKQQTIDVNAENASAQLAVHLASVASLINFCNGIPEFTDNNAISASVTTLASNVNQINQAIKMLVALADDEDFRDSLLNATGNVAAATSRLIDSTQPVVSGDLHFKGAFHDSAREVSIDVVNLLSVLDMLNVPEQFEKELIHICNALGKSVADLVGAAKNIAKSVSNQQQQQQIGYDAKNVHELANQLVVVAMTVCPGLASQVCKDQVMEGSLLLRDSVNILNDTITNATGDAHTSQISILINRVEESMSKLIDATSKVTFSDEPEFDPLDEQFIIVIDAIDHMIEAYGHPERIVVSARDSTLSATQFVNLLKAKINPQDDPTGEFMNAARKVADATAKMVQAAKEAAKNPQDEAKQTELAESVGHLRKVISKAAGPQVRERALYRLSKSIRDVISSNNQLISAAKNAAIYNRNQASQIQLNQSVRKTNELLPSLISAQKNFLGQPKNLIAQAKMTQTAKQIVRPGTTFVTAARSTAHNISDDASQAQVENAATQLEDHLKHLEKATRLVDELYAQIGVTDALMSIKEIQTGMLTIQEDNYNKAVESNVPAVTASVNPIQDLLSATNNVSRAIDQFTANVTEKGELNGQVTADALIALQNLSLASKEYALQEGDIDLRSQIMEAAFSVSETLGSLIQASKDKANIEVIALNAQQALENIVAVVPGQKQIDDAINSIGTLFSSATLNDSQPTVSSEGNQEFNALKIRKDLQRNVNQISDAINQLMFNCKGSPEQLKDAVVHYEETLRALQGTVLKLKTTTSSNEENIFNNVGANLDLIVDDSVSLLKSIKAISLSPDDQSLENELLQCSKNLGAVMEQLLNACAISNHLDTQCSQAVQNLLFLTRKLDSVNDYSENNDTYAWSCSNVTEKSKAILSCIGGNLASIKANDFEKAVMKMNELITASTSFVESAIRAAYLAGLADSASIPAQPSPIDRALFQNCSEDIKNGMATIANESIALDQPKVLELASLIARQTAQICQSCKEGVAKESSGLSNTSRQEFLTQGREIANRTSGLVTGLKKLAIHLDSVSRKECIESAQPLLQSLDTFNSIIMSSEFSGSRARLSPEGTNNQKQVLEPTRQILSALEQSITLSRQIFINEDYEVLKVELQNKSRIVTSVLQMLIKNMAANAPGQKECQEAIIKLTDINTQVDTALLEATINNLEAEHGLDRASIISAIRALNSLVNEILKAVKTNDGLLGPVVIDIAERVGQITQACISEASSIKDTEQQIVILTNTKNVVEAFSSAVSAAKTSNGNPSNTNYFGKLEQEVDKVRFTLQELLSLLEGSNVGAQYANLIERLDTIVASLDGQAEVIKTNESYPVIAKEIETITKSLADHVTNIMSHQKLTSDDIAFEKTGENMINLFSKLVMAVLQAKIMSQDPNIHNNMVKALRNVGNQMIRFVDSLKLVEQKSSGPQGNANKVKLTQSGRELCLGTTYLVTQVNEGNIQSSTCHSAISTIQESIFDIESSIIFAQAGQLDSLDQQDVFTNYQSSLLSIAKDIADQVKALLNTQIPDFSRFASASASQFTNLKTVVKKAAASITSTDKLMQVQILSASKSIGESCQALISESLEVLAEKDPRLALQNLAKTCSITMNMTQELIRAVKLQADESLKGVRALEAAIRHIEESAHILSSDSPAEGVALPDEVVTMAKQLATSGATLATASFGKQDDLIVASVSIQKLMTELLRAGHAIVSNAPQERRNQMIAALGKSANATKLLIINVRQAQELIGASADQQASVKSQIQSSAKNVATSSNDIISAASAFIPGGYVDLDDPNVIAERELLAAAGAIEAAVQRLNASAPAPQSSEFNEFDTQIFEAAKAIAAATSALIRSASRVQREIVSKGVKSLSVNEMYHSNETWANGLVSAAKMVATATQDLCESANLAVKGDVQHERVIVSSKTVSSSTAQLLAAATVRADTDSQNYVRLKAAAKAVTNATDHLVKATEKSMAIDDADILAKNLLAGNSGTSSKIMEMEAQVNILKMEKELERARAKLAAVRKGRYEVDPIDPTIAAGNRAVSLLSTNSLRDASPVYKSSNGKRTSYLLMQSSVEEKKASFEK